MTSTKCSKCGHESEKNKKKFGLPLCGICFAFAPADPVELDNYVAETLDGSLLDTFRNHYIPNGEAQKKGMITKASQGDIMVRPPFGYKVENGKLIQAENWREVQEIFMDFLNNNISLTALARKHNFSVNGLKKILTNFTYVGKIKFNNQMHEGKHPPLISSTLFNHVQNKLEKLGIKKP